jgi:hypothetical protein
MPSRIVTDLPVEEHAALKRLADACDRTLASVVRRALQYYLRHVDEVERELRRAAQEPRES